MAFRIAPWPLTDQVNCRLTVWLHPFDSLDRLTTSWPRSQLWTRCLWEWPPLASFKKIISCTCQLLSSYDKYPRPLHPPAIIQLRTHTTLWSIRLIHLYLVSLFENFCTVTLLRSGRPRRWAMSRASSGLELPENTLMFGMVVDLASLLLLLLLLLWLDSSTPSRARKQLSIFRVGWGDSIGLHVCM